jgi:co-chaperonin GroES (HSP10)
MSDEINNKKLSEETFGLEEDDMSANGFSQDKRMTSIRDSVQQIRSIHPIGMRVVVKVRPEANTTDSGLYLPEGSKEAGQESLLGEVLAVATAFDEEEVDQEANISGIPEGALVLLEKSAGVRVPWDDSLRLVETKDILAIIEEISLS